MWISLIRSLKPKKLSVKTCIDITINYTHTGSSKMSLGFWNEIKPHTVDVNGRTVMAKIFIHQSTQKIIRFSLI